VQSSSFCFSLTYKPSRLYSQDDFWCNSVSCLICNNSSDRLLRTHTSMNTNLVIGRHYGHVVLVLYRYNVEVCKEDRVDDCMLTDTKKGLILSDLGLVDCQIYVRRMIVCIVDIDAVEHYVWV
jgi:hypothetical protein